ncbi:hypothetical protein GWI72_01520 [Microvirga tunisiensis]|uniref:Uncharacterized protein n=1 Tax=Pannonibacter tanglangensis TaxID=2750084 RepID=A0A7X5EZF2_9HYPH|nr:DUF6665 family protein [Pannonibacter sp. XCT-53]NBN76941.1 hypothetical protein [Pannonibacter sp. XCT-53]
MSLRPPSSRSPDPEDPIAAALRQDVLAEKAATLARLTGKLDEALHRLAAAERRLAEAGEDERAHRLERLEQRRDEAGEALWHVIIQRELCGLRRHQEFLALVGVPASVQLRMGPARRGSEKR